MVLIIFQDIKQDHLNRICLFTSSYKCKEAGNAVQSNSPSTHLSTTSFRTQMDNHLMSCLQLWLRQRHEESQREKLVAYMASSPRIWVDYLIHYQEDQHRFWSPWWTAADRRKSFRSLCQHHLEAEWCSTISSMPLASFNSLFRLAQLRLRRFTSGLLHTTVHKSPACLPQHVPNRQNTLWLRTMFTKTYTTCFFFLGCRLWSSTQA